MVEERILEFIHHPASGNFESLALEVFEDQFDRLAVLRSRCTALALCPATVKAWQQVPAIAISATPASTRTKPGELELAATRSVFTALLDRPATELVCLPSALPSSLAAIQAALWNLAPPGSLLQSEPRLDARALRSWLGARQRDGRSVAIVATEAGFSELVAWLDRWALKFRVPAGSAAYLLGGFEAARPLEPSPDFFERVQTHLGVSRTSSRLVWCRAFATPLAASCSVARTAARESTLFDLPHWVRAAEDEDGVTLFDLACFELPARRLEVVEARVETGVQGSRLNLRRESD